MIIWGAVTSGPISNLVIVDAVGHRGLRREAHPFCTTFPEKLTGEPWVRWPPLSGLMPKTVVVTLAEGLVEQRRGCLCAGMGLYSNKAASKELCRWMACPHIYAGGRRDTAFPG